MAGSLPRPHHRDDLAPNMNPVAPAVCEFLSENLREGFALGLGLGLVGGNGGGKTEPALGERERKRGPSTRP